MQDRLLLVPVAVVMRRIGRYQQILLLLLAIEELDVGGLRQLMVHAQSGRGPAVNLLQQVVLLLAHHLVPRCRFFLASFQLVLEALSVDSHA